ncbi:antitoxin VapB family protein [Candidatus Woesearchaeota archaeon]|nr:antitoxin VapB family protein [Candidatus Woesearchaeota archaeon]
MATKTISITVEAYERLKGEKKERESFTEVINRITGRRSLLELAGILSDKEAGELRAHIKEMRLVTKKRMERVRESLK